MKDYRILKTSCDKRYEALQEISDTEILLEFSELLTSMFPHLRKTYNHCFYQYDKLSKDLYANFIAYTFSHKYGAEISTREFHAYGDSLHCYRKINRIELRPKNFPFVCKTSSGETFIIHPKDLKSKMLVFIVFGDFDNFLAMDDKYIDAANVSFDLVNFVMVDRKTGYNFKVQDNLWAGKHDVEFELVLEDFDQTEHSSYKADVFAD